jgi:ankyrin repeat protein
VYSDVNYDLLYPLILQGDTLAAQELIKRYIKAGYHPNLVDHDSKKTLLHQVVEKNLTDIAIYFMVHKMPVNTQDKFGNTPLHEAAINGNKKLVATLLNQGANPFTKNINGTTPWVFAERYGYSRRLAPLLRPRYLLLNHPNPFFSSNNPMPEIEIQYEPLDLSKPGPYTRNI